MTFQPFVLVVFDGYQLLKSTKDEEHARHAAKVSHVTPVREVDYNTLQVDPQEPFLANVDNKIAFIKLLIDYLSGHGLEACQAEGVVML